MLGSLICKHAFAASCGYLSQASQRNACQQALALQQQWTRVDASGGLQNQKLPPGVWATLQREQLRSCFRLA